MGRWEHPEAGADNLSSPSPQSFISTISKLAMKMAISATQRPTRHWVNESQVLPGKGGWPVAGLGSCGSGGRRRANGRETRLDPPLSTSSHFPSPFVYLPFFFFFFPYFPVVDLFTCPHATHEKRKIGIINSNEGFVAIGITTI